MDEPILFRGAKRKKLIRCQSPPNDSPEIQQKDQPETTEQHDHETESGEDNGSQLAALLKARKQGRARTTGVMFNNVRAAASSDEPLAEIQALTARSTTFSSMSDRFVGHTGQNIDADKHMTAYVDSEMAKRRLMTANAQEEKISASPVSDQPSVISDEEDMLPLSTQPASTHPPATNDGPGSLPTRSQASQGALQEIDLGAYRRPKPSTTGGTQKDPSQRRRKRARITKDGRIIRPRPRPRRPSTDIARDALVEQVLHENRVDHSDQKAHDNNAAVANAATQTNKAPGGERGEQQEDNDAALAAQFARDFLEAQSQRQRKADHKPGQGGAHAAVSGGAAAGAGGGVGGSKGPKLGGSRSARAAMRARELAATAAAATGTSGGGGGQGK